MTKDPSRSAGNPQISESVADQIINGAEALVNGSTLSIARQEARTQFRWRLWLTKTAAGVATPTFKLRVGALATVADTARITLVGPAQTAAVDTAFIEIIAILRSGGAGTSSVLAALLRMQHNLDNTGFAVAGTPTLEATSAGFDNTIRDSVISLTIDPGAAAVWTVKGITAEIINT